MEELRVQLLLHPCMTVPGELFMQGTSAQDTPHHDASCGACSSLCDFHARDKDLRNLNLLQATAKS